MRDWIYAVILLGLLFLYFETFEISSIIQYFLSTETNSIIQYFWSTGIGVIIQFSWQNLTYENLFFGSMDMFFYLLVIDGIIICLWFIAGGVYLIKEIYMKSKIAADEKERRRRKEEKEK